MIDITGKQDAIFIKEEYQKALDYTHDQVKKKIKWLYGMNHKLKGNLSLIQKYKKDIIAHKEEKLDSYENLSNILSKEANFEKELFKIYNKKEKTNKIILKSKIKDSQIDDITINAIKRYLKKYPEYVSKSTFKKSIEKIDEIEKGLKITKKKYNRAISEVLKELSYWPRNLMQAENLVKRFNDQLKEGNEKLKSMRYLKSIFYKFSSEREKQKVNIHTLYYRMKEMENTIKQFKIEVNKAKKQDLEEMEY